ncbi:hypothetical protein Jiend_48640 [Micromonospora endophytica]|uniref:ferredoxin--NADP reductase n=1 Tax=Micromonospora endophytica TaxID=515350 RepID=UPI001BB38534|nr:FAD-dependent oxidoreductase [Micromonospora endophytica]BCJ61442.1 hypothetical protein Jiend_48640 [Micromonospora endophytica]
MGLLSSTPLEFADRWEEDGGVAVFAFTATKPFRHIAGQHGIFTIKGGGTRPFSLASAPGDEQVVIATKLDSGSKYKKALAALRPGDRITMRGPIMKFILDGAGDEVVFLAQGVGITPFRSLLRHIDTAGLGVRSTLLHLGTGTRSRPRRSNSPATPATTGTARTSPSTSSRLPRTPRTRPTTSPECRSSSPRPAPR